MIRLDINKYCNDCPYFEAMTTSIWADGDCSTLITCEYEELCDRVYRKAMETKKTFLIGKPIIRKDDLDENCGKCGPY